MGRSTPRNARPGACRYCSRRAEYPDATLAPAGYGCLAHPFQGARLLPETVTATKVPTHGASGVMKKGTLPKNAP